MAELPAVRVARGSAYLLSSGLVGTVAHLATFPVMARLLSLDEMGAITALLIMSTVAQIASDLGFSRGLPKFVAEYRGRQADYNGIVFAGVTSKMVLTLTVSLMVFLFSSQISLLLLKTPNYADAFRLLSVYIFLSSFSKILVTVLYGLGRIRDMAWMGALQIMASSVSLVVFLLVGLRLNSLVLSWLVEAITGIVLLVGALKGSLNFKSDLNFKHNFKILIKYSWPLIVLGIIDFIYVNVDQLVLLRYVSLGDLAVYRVALTMSSYAAFALTPLATSLFPYFAEKYGEADKIGLSNAVTATSRYIALILTPAAVGLAVVADPALRLIAGEQYASGASILMIIAIFTAFTGLTTSFGTLTLVFNLTKIELLIYLVSIGTGLSLVPLLLFPFGVVAMAVIKGTSGMMSFFVTIIVLRRVLRIRFDLRALKKAWMASAIMAICVVAVEFVLPSKFLLPVYIAVGTITYLLALKLLRALNDTDVRLIQSFLPDKLKSLTRPLKFLITPKH